MGLDVGEVRTGIALSDPMGVIAQAHSVIDASSPERAVDEILKIVDEQGVVQVVVGLPLNQHGERGRQADKVMGFVAALRSRLSIDVSTIDERFTTAGAERSLIAAGVKRKGRKKVIDKLAAQQILQTYLDRRSRVQAQQNG